MKWCRAPRRPYHFRKGRDFVHPDSVGADRRHRLDVIAIDAATGAVRWSRTAYEGLVYDDRHRVGSYASPTCATDGKTLIAYFGSEGVFAYDFAGTPAVDAATSATSRASAWASAARPSWSATW